MVRTVISIGFLLRILVAGWNGFYGPSYGADMDALTFHLDAVRYSGYLELYEFSVKSFYSYLLATIYFAASPSLFLGSLLSCIAWFASASVLRKTMNLCSMPDSAQASAMLIYAFLPSSVLWTSVTMREAYQLLFVNLAVYSSLAIHNKKPLAQGLTLLLAGACMGLFHQALIVFGIFVVSASAILFVLRQRSGVSAPIFAFAGATALALVSLYVLSQLNTAIYAVDDGFESAVQDYQQGGLSIVARTQYKDFVDTSGIAGFLLFIPVSLLQYLFEPMPWRVSALADVGVVLENLLRAWLILKVCNALRRAPAEYRKTVLMTFIPVLALETIWSLGTVSWGTAARHHIPSLGLLVVSAFSMSQRRSAEDAVGRVGILRPAAR